MAERAERGGQVRESLPVVYVNGDKYVPEGRGRSTLAGGDPGRIGVAITTRNRRAVALATVEAWRARLPEGAVLVVVDDASDKPFPGADLRFVSQQGVARAKNAGIALLMDAGVDHLFLADDDVSPLVDDWWEPYVASAEPHLMLCWGDEVYRDEKAGLVGFNHPNGCLLYAERRVVDRVGGLDVSMPRHEHVNWSDRIHNAGLTSVAYGDVPDSEKLFGALDRDGSVESSFPEGDVRRAGFRALLDGRGSDRWLPYRRDADDSPILLSVLVATVSSRWNTFLPKIEAQLYGQYEELVDWARAQVEILVVADTGSMTLGAKRSRMVEMAQGRYVAFVDDDDRLSDDYLVRLLEGCRSGADVVTFDVEVSMNGAAPRLCRYSLDYRENANTATEYHRLPNHLMAVRRALSRRAGFPDQTFNEDSGYAIRLRPFLACEHHVDEVLYRYDFSDDTTVGQKSWQDEVTRQILPPRADLVILSKASTPELAAMTQHTVDSARAHVGTNRLGDQLNLQVIVMEQEPGVRYRGAVTVPSPGEFWYNRSMNKGAARGRAPWIVFANSDLDFEEGWLGTLLDADHELVSPGNPGDSRQRGISRPESGWTNGRHFCGWCFMMKRSLWERLGGLDPDFRFWCADDSVIEQARAAGVPPMLVPDAHVRHLVSRTIGDDQADDSGAMTWAMVRLFEEKYGVKKFERDQRYTDWKARNPT